MEHTKTQYHCTTCGITLTTDSEAKVLCFVCTVPLKLVDNEKE